MYKTRVVGKAWNDHLLKTTVPEGVIYQFGNNGTAVAFDRYPSFTKRELLRRSANGHEVGV
jgi:hypothetical protein